MNSMVSLMRSTYGGPVFWRNRTAARLYPCCCPDSCDSLRGLVFDAFVSEPTGESPRDQPTSKTTLSADVR